VPDITIHVTTFSDGTSSRMLDFEYGGTDETVSIRLPNGPPSSRQAERLRPPLVDGRADYPYNVQSTSRTPPAASGSFRGKGYGQLGRQTVFSTGAVMLNISLPLKGGTNSSSAIRLPKGATVTSAVMNVTNLRGGGGGAKIAIEAGLNCRSRDTQNNDPVYSIQSLLQQYGWTADIVSGSDIDSPEELAPYSAVITGDSGYNDDDHGTFDKASTPGSKTAAASSDLGG